MLRRQLIIPISNVGWLEFHAKTIDCVKETLVMPGMQYLTDGSEVS